MEIKGIPVVHVNDLDQQPVNVDKSLLAPRLEFNRRTAKIAKEWGRVRGGANKAPISLQVALTDRCFNRCIMCDHPLRKPREIPVDAWLDFINGRVFNVDSVCYSGGDPMAYRDFNKVMQWHVASGVAFGMTITGYVPPYIDLSLMKEAAWVRCSLDAVTPEVYAQVRGHTPVHKVLESIENMLRNDVYVGLGITVHKQNEADLPNVLRWAKEHAIHDIDVRPVYPDSKLKEPPIERNIMPFNNCHAALYQLYIDADGAVYPCCITAGDTLSGATADSLGNILTEPWGVIWPRVVDYTTIPVQDLPEICRTCCVQRLSEINYVCGHLARMDDKLPFF